MKEKLAPCPDCENPVSTSAYFYVHCGRPLPAKPTTTDTVIKVIISAIAVAILFGPITLLLVFLFGAVNAKAAETNLLSLPPEPVTITNLSGKVYANVLLDHPTPDGIICTSQDKTSEGMIRYLDMTTNDLIRLKISPNVLDIAAARNAQRIRAGQAYNQAMIQAAIRQHEADMAQSNTLLKATGDPIDTWVDMKRALGKPEKGKAGLYH